MTKEITKAYIIQQIGDKFKLRDLEPTRFTFSEEVVPIYNIDPHLKTWLTHKTIIAVASSGGKNILGVPENERWTIHGYTVVFMAAGAYTVAGVYIRRTNNVNYFVYLDLAAAKSASYTINLPKDVVLDSGDSLYINVDGYTSPASLEVIVDLVKETIR